jgi:hypothetical protein
MKGSRTGLTMTMKGTRLFTDRLSGRGERSLGMNPVWVAFAVGYVLGVATATCFWAWVILRRKKEVEDAR